MNRIKLTGKSLNFFEIIAACLISILLIPTPIHAEESTEEGNARYYAEAYEYCVYFRIDQEVSENLKIEVYNSADFDVLSAMGYRQ